MDFLEPLTAPALHDVGILSVQEDTDELEHIVNTELGKYDKERIRVTNEITRDVTEVK